MDGDDVYGTVFVESTIPTVVLDNAGCIVELNPAYERMTHQDRAYLLGSSSIEFIHAGDLPGVISGLDVLLRGEPMVRHRRRHVRADGSWIVIEVVTSLIANPDGGDNLILVQITDQEPGDATVIDPENELLTRQLYQPAGDAACIHDPDGRVAFSTDGLATLLGQEFGWMTGRLVTDDALEPIRVDGSTFTDPDPVIRAIRDQREVTTTLGVITGDGRRIWLSVVSGPVDRAALPARTSLRDITELIEAQHEARRLSTMVEEQLTYLANHDDLTGLASRRSVLANVDESLDALEPVSVVFVDLNGFKVVNDELGHLAGDRILVEVARRLEGFAGATTTVGRTGGDEFVAVTSAKDEAEEFADVVRQAAIDPSGMVPASSVTVGASVGVAHSIVGDTSTSLLARADAEMYQAKRATRAR